MDTTAQNPQGQNQQASQVAQPDTVSTSGNVPQTSVPPVIPSPMGGGHPEQGPMKQGLPPREAAPVDETEVTATVSDDQAVVPDEATDAADAKQHEAADAQMQEAHPPVEVPKKLQEVGVEKGKDADRDQLPEEQIAKAYDVAKQPDTQAAASGITLPMTVQQAEETKKKSKIRDSLKWLAELILYEWKSFQAKSQNSETKKPEQIVK